MTTVPAFPRNRELLRRVIEQGRKQNPAVTGLTRVGATFAVLQAPSDPRQYIVPVTAAEAVELGWVAL